MFLRLPSRFAAARDGARVQASRTGLLRGGLVAIALGISACSTSNVLNVRPDVDIGTQTAAVQSSGGMQDLVPDDPYLQQAEARQQPAEPEEPTYAEQSTSVGDTLEPEQPEVAAGGPPYLQAPGAAGQQAAMASPPADSGLPDGPSTDGAEPAMAEPAGQQVAMISPAGSGLPLAVDEPTDENSEPPVAAPVEPAPAPVLAAYPRLNKPVVSGDAMPAEEMAFRRELKKLGVSFRELAPIRDSASCYIAHPIKVSGLPGGIQLKPAATLNAEMALTFAKWTKDELNPAARTRYWSRVKTIHQMSSYSCRRINGSHSMSEHSKGNALDVGRIELANGKDIDVRKPGLFAFRTRGFLNTVRADGCEYFTTVLGPGYNYDHRNHFHFDIKPRKSGRVACH